MMATQNTSWRLDKTIPVSVIVTLLLQTGGAIWWAASFDGRVNYLERTSPNIEQVTAMRIDIASVKQDLAVVKEDIRRISVRGK